MSHSCAMRHAFVAGAALVFAVTLAAQPTQGQGRRARQWWTLRHVLNTKGYLQHTSANYKEDP